MIYGLLFYSYYYFTYQFSSCFSIHIMILYI